MTNTLRPLPIAQLACVTGGASSTPNGTSVLDRAAKLKPGANSLDLYGYQQTGSQGVGAEYLHRFSPNVSGFVNGHVGTKNGVQDEGIMGGLRVQW